MKTRLNLTGIAPGTGSSETKFIKVDFEKMERVVMEFNLTGRVTADATTPVGSSKTLGVSYYWSDYDFAPTVTPAANGAVADTTNGLLSDVAGALVATRLADRKTSPTAKNLTSTAGIVQEFKFNSSAIRIEARFLMISFTPNSHAAGVTVELNLVQVTPTNR